MGVTSIEWTSTVYLDGSVTPGRTWNPVRGCSRVSEGCRHCYAERIAARYAGGKVILPGGREQTAPFYGFAEATASGPRWTGRVELIPEKLDEPLRWKKPARIFVNSMSDLFHEKLANLEIAAVFGVMAAAPQHTFQVLTKRPARMRSWFEWVGADGLARIIPWPLPNVWAGVSVEDQATADERIPLLLQTPAAVRFVSYEPALSGVDFEPWLGKCPACNGTGCKPGRGFGAGCAGAGLSWLIVGGESGPKARLFDLAWARSTIAACKATGVPVFYKQGGSSQRCPHSSKGGHLECFPPDLQVREFPNTPAQEAEKG